MHWENCKAVWEINKLLIQVTEKKINLQEDIFKNLLVLYATHNAKHSAYSVFGIVKSEKSGGWYLRCNKEHDIPGYIRKYAEKKLR